MLKKELVEQMKNDKELHDLRAKYRELSGEVASYDLTHPISVEEWKEELRKEINELSKKASE